MCGIVGRLQAPDFDVEAALEAIAHRGPDYASVVSPADGVEHGHCRLSIMDPHPRSNQPFVYGGVLLSFNGEIWNYRELRTRLSGEGVTFRTEGDTEVVAAALSVYGAEAIALLDGQFALAWTDSRGTFVARDRLGEVPLYVLETDGSLGAGGVMWSSERRVWNGRGAEARPVPAGCVWKLGGGTPEPFYELPERTVNAALSADATLELIRAAVRRRLMSDVPVAFLSSGGVDSTLILKLVREVREDVVAYTTALPGHQADVAAARRACAELGVELREVPLTFDEDSIPEAIRVIETPMKTQVEIAVPCLALARQISADGFRVVLSGEGADELFGGYGSLKRKATADEPWYLARRASVEKMARGNCIRTNKSFMAYGVEARLPFLDRDLVDAVLPLALRSCPPGKGLLKDAARLAGLPPWVIDQPKRTFQGAAGISVMTNELYGGRPVKEYNRIAHETFGGIPRGYDDSAVASPAARRRMVGPPPPARASVFSPIEESRPLPEPALFGEVVASQLTAEAARALTDEVKADAAALWTKLLHLYEGEAHTALGYASWADFFNAEFRQLEPGQRLDPKHPYRLLRAARVEAEVSVHVDTTGMREAHARVLGPLAAPVREEVARRVAEEEGGFRKVTAARVRQIRDEVLGLRHLVGGRLVWDERALRAAASAVLRGGALAGAFADLDGLRELPPEDAARVRAVIAAALVDVDRARRAAQAAVTTLEDAAHVLEGRGDLPGPPFPSESWEGFDVRVGVPKTRQMTVQDVLTLIRDEEAAEREEPDAAESASEPPP